MADFYHDLRNRLTVLKGNLDLLDAKALDDENRNMLETAKQEIQEIQKLIEQAEKTES